ncbi:MAG: TetR/AcrR family transcriptional regulator [Deltaproteobacteria bacterium]
MSETISDNPVAQRILDIAQELLQERGYNSFSYRDLSRQVGIKTSSIHYYFPTKERLAKALTVRYRERFQASLTAIDGQSGGAEEKFEIYLNLFLDGFRSCKKICLCSMLAADFANLPASVQDEIKGLFRDNEAWLAKLLQTGGERGAFKFEADCGALAKVIFAALEGATISGRIFSDDTPLRCLADLLRETLKSES